VQLRRRSEADIEQRDFAIMTYKPTYMLYSRNSEFDPSSSTYNDLNFEFENLKKEEVKFQVSAKFPLWRNMWGSDTDMYFGYTQTSWWQLFADEGLASAPFRETNYEPEIFVRHFSDIALPLEGTLSTMDLSLVHQSNGRSELLSRSWNRVMGRAMLDYGNLALLGRLWYRIPEDEKDDDNPKEYRYLGYGDIRAVWAPNKNTISAMWRPGTEESGVELTWSYPISEALRVYAQWWYGYGESLIDYDRKVNRFGIGVALSDFLMRDD
jgi:phospholipase A1